MSDRAGLSDDQKRRRVAEVFVKPLVDEGMVRRRGVKLEEHEKWIEGLKTRLAYMDPENLIAMRHGIARAAGGTHRNQWPSILSITNMAHTMQFPPDSDGDFVISYMASVAGRRAWARGPEYAMSLHLHLRTVRRPPVDYNWQKINGRAAELAAKALIVAERLSDGVYFEEDPVWQRDFGQHKAHVKSLVFARVSEQEANKGEVAA
ncbi:MAG: hypothetical protein COB08_000795 [Rhodobacteraceae bacterium]|nr:hypothetical protein [Paracoccaceae bacterium]